MISRFFAMAAAVALLGGCARTSPEMQAPAEAPAPKQQEAAVPAPAIAETEEPEGPTEQEFQQWLAFEPQTGMTRDAIEAGLGEATHTARDKEGRQHVLYAMKSVWKSVTYDDRGVAVRVYP